MIALYIILAIAAIFLLIIFIRAACFNPKKSEIKTLGEEEFDKESSVFALGELIKCKTVSYRNKELEDDAEFEKLINLLPKLYPNVFKVCNMTKLEDRGILFKWKGKNDGAPAVMMAHYDVVPADEKNWEKPAFEAIIEDGVMWGRGTLDTKVTFNGILSGAENLIKKGFIPENDIYFAFSGGEETQEKGAVRIVEWFENNKITPAFVIDEGGAVVENIFPGVKEPCALIGIAEKGTMDLEYEAESAGGHASAPKKHTPVGILSEACCKIENHPFKFHITKPAAEMFDTLGRRSTFLFKLIFANLWCFKGVLNIICKKSGGELNALVRTTVAFTQMQGSSVSNVIPPSAKMVSNIRLNPEDTIESAIEYISKIIGNDNVKLSVSMGNNPSRISRTDCVEWEKISAAVSNTWKGSVVSPYLMVQCSDSRHYGRISDKVYRFSAMALTAEERATIHGNNEKIKLETINKAVEFYMKLMRQC